MIQIEPIKQEGTHMCIPACLEMVIKILQSSNTINQHTIMKEICNVNEVENSSNYANSNICEPNFSVIEEVLKRLNCK